MKEEESWQVVYPEGLVKYIDYFRSKYLQHKAFDTILNNYIDKYSKRKGKRVCSLGAGTGRHEVELAKMGYEVVGVERNKESIDMAYEYSKEHSLNIEFIECDFLDKEDVKSKMEKLEKFDIIMLLYVPISVNDCKQVIENFSDYILPKGLFITDLFGYAEEIDSNKLITSSEVEVADSPDKKDYAVRLNSFEYHNNIVHWDAIYLYQDDDKKLCMGRDHDIFEVSPEQDGIDPLSVDIHQFNFLDTHRVVGLHDYANPPYLCNYIAFWEKK